MLKLQCSLNHKQSLSHELKLLLKQVLAQRLELRHPEIPHAAKGLEGMLIADSLLKERNATGILIGGLADAIWNKQRTEEELYAHKDTDVLVLSEDFTVKENFEKGIDWWLPQKAHLRIHDGYTSYEGEEHWWQNGNDVVLRYGVLLSVYANPGLYLPSVSLVTSMRVAEIMTGIDTNRIEIAEGFEDALYMKIEKSLGKSTPSFIKKAFPQSIYDLNESVFYLEVENFSIAKITAIHTYLEKK